MTFIVVDSESHTKPQLLKNREKCFYAKQENSSFEQFKKNFDEDCKIALTSQQFMIEMEQRIKKWQNISSYIHILSTNK